MLNTEIKHHKFRLSSHFKAWSLSCRKSLTSPLYLKIGQSVSKWSVVWWGLPQSQLGLAIIFHLWSISLQRPCPVLSLFRLHQIFLGSVNSSDLEEWTSNSNRLLPRPLFDHRSFHTSFGLKSVASNVFALVMAGCRDFNRSRTGSTKSFFSGISSPLDTLRYNASSLLWRRMFGGSILLSADSQSIGVEEIVPVIVLNSSSNRSHRFVQFHIHFVSVSAVQPRRATVFSTWVY